MFLDHLLMGSSSSTLYKALIDSGLGESVIGGGFSDDLIQGTYSAGMKGVKTREDAKKVRDLIAATLENIVHEGFPKAAIEASMNSVSFRAQKLEPFVVNVTSTQSHSVSNYKT
jgi:Zn-dependent M16 (insulinase) family peptidase